MSNHSQHADSSNTQLNAQTTKKPDETGGFYISGMIRITDPNTGQVLLHKRADE